MSIQEATTPVRIHFHFDPLCPLAWRTALWVREVRQARPLDIQWRFFSLEVVNRKEGTEPDYVSNGWGALRTLALAQRQKGNEAVEKLYVALGDAQHDGEEAAELWDYTAWALKQPNLFELKRDRAQAQWGPVSSTDY
jgi:predicted DsbA family dithiol-disulfide isomerase